MGEIIDLRTKQKMEALEPGLAEWAKHVNQRLILLHERTTQVLGKLEDVEKDVVEHKKRLDQHIYILQELTRKLGLQQ